MSASEPDGGSSERVWEQAWEQGWEGHELAQRRRMADLPFSEKLKWLEETHELVLALRASRRAAKESQSSPVPKDP